MPFIIYFLIENVYSKPIKNRVCDQSHLLENENVNKK